MDFMAEPSNLVHALLTFIMAGETDNVGCGVRLGHLVFDVVLVGGLNASS